jgi:hypothetical protein
MRIRLCDDCGKYAFCFLNNAGKGLWINLMLQKYALCFCISSLTQTMLREIFTVRCLPFVGFLREGRGMYPQCRCYVWPSFARFAVSHFRVRRRVGRTSEQLCTSCNLTYHVHAHILCTTDLSWNIVEQINCKTSVNFRWIYWQNRYNSTTAFC